MWYVARRAVDACEPALSYLGRRSDIVQNPPQHMQPRSKPLSAVAVGGAGSGLVWTDALLQGPVHVGVCGIGGRE
jgi:hypothetical protein